MSTFNVLQNTLSLISSAMLYPVMILLIIFFIWMIIIVGGFVSEYAERRGLGGRRDPKEFVGYFTESSPLQIQKIQGMPRYFRVYVDELVNELRMGDHGKEIRVEYLLQSKEQEMTRSLDKLRLMIRAGPTLGLMGTIIPMGPALSALSHGDLEKLSSNIIIAFTTTVVGLAIGIVAYFLSMMKNRWIHEDIKNLEYFTEYIMKDKESFASEERRQG
ncbi:MAG: hypothetical protein DCC43_12740 [Candidatus Brocadia sp.]|nr:hypothetical protein [Candidatus Brocadia fulgida]MCC6324825.1 MotA/TolQ/ExbB proton channel family protein [Candidatus Brocadia sp.]MCE7912711.1 MotA/TolQ/ExbB proton channel family protein [Candidatus Brocadia sp. AMX3]MDG5997137.1 MotA/TolQ/ExbB proton channel family protein [Candidatus Brocadia sp.]RIJ93941.1 MAG: hypothetical protein DCC43_12740 [Candidatus Brocadia sp.]